MRKTFLTTLLALIATMGIEAQQAFQKMPLKLNATAAARGAHHATIQPADNQAWWGNVSTDEEISGVGVSAAETYDCAFYIPASHAVAAGKTIKAIRFAMIADNAIDVKVWIAESRPTNIATGTVRLVDVENFETEGAYNDVELPEPYTVDKNIYVGLTFTIGKASTSNDKYPIPVAGDPAANMLWVRTSESVTAWQDLNDYGRLCMQVLLEGDFEYQNAAQPGSIEETVVAPGTTATAALPLTNPGLASINDFDYVVTTDGADSEEHHVTLAKPIPFGGTGTVDVAIDADEPGTVKQKTLTVTKVNGQLNEAEKQTTALTVTTVTRLAHRGIVVEQYTGTTCGWCPRGHVGMAKMKREFPDDFIGIAIHRYTSTLTQDAMYLSTYNHVSFGGAPSARINRGAVIDPYYGSAYDVFDDFRQAQSVPAKVAIDLSGQWNEDSTKVIAHADIEALIDGNYAIEYVLVADSLTGTTQPWRQHNYYNKAYGQYTDPKQLPADLGFLVNTGENFGSYIAYYPYFNDVAITVAKQAQTTAPGQLTTGQTVENSFTIDMPTASNRKNLIEAINKKDVYVVALLIDKKNNRIANAAKASIGEYVPEPPLAEGTYYLQNVATGKYLAAGHDWGTRAIVNEDGLDFSVAISDGKYTFDSQVTNGGDNHFLGNGLYVDAAAFPWTVEEAGEGIITISDGTAFLAAGADDNTVLAAEADATAQWKVVTYADRVAALAGATLDQPSNATFAIRHANFNRNDQRSSAWTVTAGNPNLSGGNNVNNVAESYMAAFNIEQTIAGLPNGAYMLQAQAAVTYHDDRTVKDYDGQGKPVIYANGQTATFLTMDAADQLSSMSQMSEQFTAGRYEVKPIYCYVEDGTLTVGAKSDRADIWAVWDNFRLTYLGTTMPELTLDFAISCEREAGQGDTPTKATVSLAEAADYLDVDAVTAAMLSAEDSHGNIITDYAALGGWFDADGNPVAMGDRAKLCVKFYEAIEGDGTFSISDTNAADEVGKTYTVRWRLDNGYRTVRYTIDVTFTTPSGISQISGEEASQPVYNLNGQQVKQPAKGIYIIGGKKTVLR